MADEGITSAKNPVARYFMSTFFLMHPENAYATTCLPANGNRRPPVATIWSQPSIPVEDQQSEESANSTGPKHRASLFSASPTSFRKH
jgi:hypothetical protein